MEAEAPNLTIQEKEGFFEIPGISKRWYESAVHAILIVKKRECGTWLKGMPEYACRGSGYGSRLRGFGGGICFRGGRGFLGSLGTGFPSGGCRSLT